MALMMVRQLVEKMAVSKVWVTVGMMVASWELCLVDWMDQMMVE
jgi:hypothetical protein